MIIQNDLEFRRVFVSKKGLGSISRSFLKQKQLELPRNVLACPAGINQLPNTQMSRWDTGLVEWSTTRVHFSPIPSMNILMNFPKFTPSTFLNSYEFFFNYAH